MDTITTDDLLLNPDPTPAPKPIPRYASKDAHATADALGLLREWAKVFTLTASSCACCGKDLRDSVSVTMGIGPDCSSQHYSVPHRLTDEMVQEAMGRLAASHLDSRVKVAVKGLKDKPRDLCNVLVWWSSVNLNNADVVLECAEVVDLLGFTTLGGRLRERNTNVVVSKDGTDHFILRCKAKVHVTFNMRRVKEASAVAREGRFKFGWQIPVVRKDLVWAILGEDFGGQWATVPAKDDGPSRVVKITRTTPWEVRKAFQAAYNPPQPVQVTPAAVVAPVPPPAPPVTIVRVASTGNLEVHTPTRNWQFVAELKLLPSPDRRWDPDGYCWRVASKHETKVRELVATHFNGAV